MPSSFLSFYTSIFFFCFLEGIVCFAGDTMPFFLTTDAGQQTTELKPGKERSFRRRRGEEESQRRGERRVRRCKICNFH
jgi:hypothetical protein